MAARVLTVRILTDTIIVRNLTIRRREDMSYHKLMMENHTFFSRKVFERLSSTGLSTGQPKILEYLFSHDGAIQKDIAEACAVEPATATSLLSRMEKNGLVERRSKDGDRRYTCVFLTEKGRTDAVLSIGALTGLEETALDGFSEDEKERFISYLKRVNDNLRK